MRQEVWIPVSALILFIVLLYAEKGENRRILIPAKTLLSSLFVVAACLQPASHPRYAPLIITGLVFCMGGDFFLALPQKKAFFFGLLAFLLGHVLYILAFFSMARIGPGTGIGLAVCIPIGGLVFWWLKPHLGSMERPVLLYVAAITLMVAGACTLMGDTRLDPKGRILGLTGACSFYVSDLFVARDRFLTKGFENRLLGLPLYYLGQFLMAFSVGHMP